MTEERLSKIDTALLRMEDPTNLMLITTLMITRTSVDYSRLKATLEARLLRMDRFRQRVAWPLIELGAPYWEDDPNFDLNYHLQQATLPPPGDQAALQDVVSLLASTPLDLSRSPWQFHLIENCCEGSALVCRFHHCIADGTAIVHIVLSMTETDPDAPVPVIQPRSPQPAGTHPLGALHQPAHSRLRARRRAASKAVRNGLDLLVHPSRVLELGRAGSDAAADLARFLLLDPDSDTILRGKLGASKRVAWSQGIPLEEVKLIRRSLGGTVNDVMLAAVTGAFRHYLRDRGEPVDSLSFRAAIPVNLRPPGREAELGNHMGAIFLSLPVNVAGPADRLRAIEHRMNDHKNSSQAPLFYVLLNALGMTPARVANSLLSINDTRTTAVMTNVRGPQQRIYLAGAPVECLLGWVPTTGRLGVGISILSYFGKVTLGVFVDEGLVPDPDAIVKAFNDEFDALMALALDKKAEPTLSASSAMLDDALSARDEMIEDGK